MDALNLDIEKAYENLRVVGIDFDVVDTCPDLCCEVCRNDDLSIAA